MRLRFVAKFFELMIVFEHLALLRVEKVVHFRQVSIKQFLSLNSIQDRFYQQKF